MTLNREDGALTFKRLSPSDRIRFRNAFALYRKMQLYRNLAIAEVKGTDALKALNEFDARPIENEAVVEWVNTPEGKMEAVLLSLQKDKPEAMAADVDALQLSDYELLQAAAGVLHLQIVNSPAKEGDHPLSVGDPGETVTGSGTPISSGAGSIPMMTQ